MEILIDITLTIALAAILLYLFASIWRDLTGIEKGLKESLRIGEELKKRLR
jgi:hypothetical protein